MNTQLSHELFHAAQNLIPGGVNSPVRAFKSVGGDPLFIKRADGPWLEDVDGNRYIDYVGSWGPMIAGHRNPAVIAALQEQLETGTSFGAPTAIESELAARIIERLPSIERVRMCSSGTEAAMSAIRLARGFTGRDRIVKFEGCYHGHADSLLVKAGSGALTLGTPSSPGVPAALAALTITLDYNNPQQLRDFFKREGDTIAAVAVEPVAGNMNCIPPSREFLETLREVTTESGAVLLFDEVMTGFRVDRGGVQTLYGITPDLTCLGKVIGGGMPVGAFGGRADIMAQIAPEGPVYQAGTLSGNPLAMACGLATLEQTEAPGFYDKLAAATETLMAGMRDRAAAAGVPLATNHVPAMFGLFFTEADSVANFADVMACDVDRFAAFFRAMLNAGVYLAPSAFEAGFLSSTHDEAVIAATLDAAEQAFGELQHG